MSLESRKGENKQSPGLTHPSGGLEVRLELLEDGPPDQVEAAEEVAGQQGLVELGEVLREEVGEGTDGLLGGEILWRPGQVEHVLPYTRLQLGRRTTGVRTTYLIHDFPLTSFATLERIW